MLEDDSGQLLLDRGPREMSPANSASAWATSGTTEQGYHSSGRLVRYDRKIRSPYRVSKSS